MKKKGKSQSRSKSIFILLLVLLVLATALVFTFISFPYGEDGIQIYKGTVGGIEKDADVGIGFYAVLESVTPGTKVEEDNFDENMKKAAEVIQKRLSYAGYNQVTVVEQIAPNKSKSIRIEMPSSSQIGSVTDAKSFIDSVVMQGKLEFRIEGEEDPLLTNSDIVDASVIINYNGSGIIFNLTEEGKKKYADNIDKTIEIYIDETSIFSYKINDKPPQFGTKTGDQAKNFGMLFNNGINPIQFKSFEAKEINPSLGENISTLLLVAGIVGVLLAIALIIAVYKGLGIVSALSLLTFIVVFLFLILQLPVQLGTASVLAILLSIGIFAGANITVFERIKEEYASGRSLGTSVKNGFRRAGAAIIDFSVVLLVLAIIILIFGGPARDFAIILSIGVVLSIALCYSITRLFIKLLLPINDRPKFYGLKRGIIEDEE